MFKNYLTEDLRCSFIGANDWRMVEKSYLRLLGDFTTVRGTCFPADGYASFSLGFEWNTLKPGMVLYVGLGKPYELAVPDACRITIAITAGSITVYNAKERITKNGLSGNRLVINGRENKLSVSTGDIFLEFSSLAEERKGYACIWSEIGAATERTVEMQHGTEAKLFNLSLESEYGLKPETEEQHINQEKEWLAWQTERTERKITEFEKYALEHPDMLAHPVGDIKLPCRMVDCGAKQEVTFEWYGGNEPKVYIVHNFRQSNSTKEECVLKFKTGDNGFYAEAIIEYPISGNTLIEMTDGKESLQRIVGVYDKGYLVVTPWVGHNEPLMDEEVHRFGIPGDYELQIHNPVTISAEDLFKAVKRQVEMYYKYGDRIAASAAFYEYFPGTTHWNTYEIDADNQKKMIEWSLRIMRAVGIDKVETLAGYTNNNITVDIAEEKGIKALTNMCIWQNWADAGMGHINHWGAANAPYCPAPDDVRHANDKNRPIIATSIGTSSNVRNWGIMAQDGCPTLTMGSQRYEGTDAQFYNAQRFYDTFEGYLYDVKNNDGPLFVKICIENFIGSDDWRRANANAIEYMMRRAKTEKIIFVSAADVADYYAAHDIAMQETVFIQNDFYAGIRVDLKPPMLPLRIEWENTQFMAQFAEGTALPEFLFDYTVSWNGPMWEDGIRNAEDVIDLEKCPPVTLFPPQMDNRDTQVSVKTEEIKDGLKVSFLIHNETDKKWLPLVAHCLPISGGAEIVKSDAMREKLLVDGFTGNVYLIVLTNLLKAGDNTVSVIIRAEKKQPIETVRNFGNGLCAKEVRTFEGKHLFLWSDDKKTSLKVKLNARLLPENWLLRQNNGEETANDGEACYFTINSGWENESPTFFGVGISDIEKALIEVVKGGCRLKNR